nr:hypothetical protein R03G5.4 - Caenorhabditis elegans [Caenorhabditis elegans]
MKIQDRSLLIFLVLGILKSDAFNTRVKRHAPIRFQRSTRQSVVHFEFLDQEYVVDLEPNHSTFHENFKVFTQDGPQIVPRDEYIGTVREPRAGRAVLTQLEENVYIGSLYFVDDTLHLEPSYPHQLSDDLGPVVGYFESDLDLNLDLSAMPVRNQVSFRRANPFLKHRRAIAIPSDRRKDVLNVKRNRCTLKLVADYSFYSIFGKNNTGIVTKFLVNMIARVNEIYTPINWDVGKEDDISGRGRYGNLTNLLCNTY